MTLVEFCFLSYCSYFSKKHGLMKRFQILFSVIALGILSVVFTSCGSHTGSVVYPNSVTATVGGVLAFSASGATVNAFKTNGTLNITATASNKSKITFSVPSFTGTAGTLAINHIGLPAGASFDSLGNGVILLANTGSITFTQVTPYLVGTFNFTCTDSAKITGGAFKIKAP